MVTAADQQQGATSKPADPKDVIDSRTPMERFLADDLGIRAGAEFTDVVTTSGESLTNAIVVKVVAGADIVIVFKEIGTVPLHMIPWRTVTRITKGHA